MTTPKVITGEMRKQLRVPLPNEAVSPHPTKPYLSSIKSIYVAERINNVFGIGTWTLKGEVMDILEKNIVMRVVLEIPEYGFYGEAYGGNDNLDRGDAFKGAVTDGLTKIAAQQLEIGIDVFKGIHGNKPASQKETKPDEKTGTVAVSPAIVPSVFKVPGPGTLKKPTRDVEPIKTINDMLKACNADFGLQPKQVIKELGYSSQSDISEPPGDCYLKIVDALCEKD